MIMDDDHHFVPFQRINSRNDFDVKKDSNIVTVVCSRRRQNLDGLFLEHRKVMCTSAYLSTDTFVFFI